MHEATASQKRWVQDLLATELAAIARSPRAVARHLFFLIEGAATVAMYEPQGPVAADLREAALVVLDAAEPKILS